MYYNVKLKFVSLNACEELGLCAFYWCSSIQFIHLKARKVGGNAFQGCTSLKSASLPNALEIGDYGFYQCCQLARVSIPNAKIVGKNCFCRCQALKSVLSQLDSSQFAHDDWDCKLYKSCPMCMGCADKCLQNGVNLE